MSDEEKNTIAEQVAILATKVEERTKTGDRMYNLLIVVAGVVLVQFLTTVFVAGQKIQKLDTLADAVTALASEVHSQKNQ